MFKKKKNGPDMIEKGVSAMCKKTKRQPKPHTKANNVRIPPKQTPIILQNSSTADMFQNKFNLFLYR